MPLAVDRRRFLTLAAMSAAAGAVVACAPGARVASTPTVAPAAAVKADAPKPAADAPKPAAEAPKPAAPPPPAAPTTAPLAVSQAQATATPVAKPGRFKESPELAKLVGEGKLPPVEKRLPDNPRVLKVFEETGQFGGVWRRAYRGLADYLAVGKLIEERIIEWDAPKPDQIGVVANFIEKWEQNADATNFTFYLRKGLKWSDGVEVTTDDIKFWWDDVQLNRELVPAPSQLIRQRVENEWKIAQLTVIDKYTWTIKYPVPFALLPIWIANNGGNSGHLNVPYPGLFLPAHYFKKFLPKYSSKDELDKQARDKKLANWVELWGKGGAMDGPIGSYMLNGDAPTVAAWKTVKPLPADPMRLERNPFYWQVDEQGNQLPYLDAVEHSFYENTEVFKLWIAQGKIDCQNRGVDTAAFTFFKENEQKGGYRILPWRSASTTSYFPNMNTPDPELRKLFQAAEFREALNVAVNRKEISEVIYSGLAKPRQYGPIKGSPEYDEAMEQRWTQYDPKRANDLLDGLGLKKGADGIRLRSDGKPLEVTIEHSDAPGSSANDTNELIRKYWTAIGVKTSVKAVDRALYTEHFRAGEIEVGKWGWDRASVNKTQPGRWLGTISDGPWAPLWGHWYDQAPWKKEEPPKDHWIRKIWSQWEKTQQEPDEAKRNAHFQEIINIHKQAPVAVGVVGEAVSIWVVKSNFRNVPSGYINDDTLRDYGLVNPAQFFFKK